MTETGLSYNVNRDYDPLTVTLFPISGQFRTGLS